MNSYEIKAQQLNIFSCASFFRKRLIFVLAPPSTVQEVESRGGAPKKAAPPVRGRKGCDRVPQRTRSSSNACEAAGMASESEVQYSWEDEQELYVAGKSSDAKLIKV
ncbi:hypothetical protein AVEN_264515-1 [Araneus ventricosus]|uniref:Uncharacterized protein n=1 Tax=Araneus ventricosus TaxID=182803 RepID=A0A4Y2J8J2_ARAVE|nr:hypothetical protein AVEN_264515-1 [Araneus ventricosus]